MFKKKIPLLFALSAAILACIISQSVRAELGREEIVCPDGLNPCAKVVTPTGPKYYHKGN
jgi:hypothetical protein